MIAKISGQIIEVTPPYITVNLGNIAYEISLSLRDFDNQICVGGAIEIFTHFIVREDAQLLYGFKEKSDRTTFRELIKISGIGPKVAMALLSTYSSNELINLIDTQNVTMLAKAVGVGKKTAERIILELSGKLITNNQQNISQQHLLKNDLNLALLSLGYTQKQVDSVIPKLDNTTTDLNLAIKAALKFLSS